MYIINWYIHVVHEICCIKIPNTNKCWYLYLIRWHDISLQNTNISSDLSKTSHHTKLSQNRLLTFSVPVHTKNSERWPDIWIQDTNISSLSHYTKISQGDILIKLKVNVNVFVTSKWYVKKKSTALNKTQT